MSLKFFQLHSIKARVTLFTLAIFITSIWTISFYVGRMLQLDMERVLGEQQFTTVSMVAADINEDIQSRLDALEVIAGTIASTLPGGAAATQKALENFPVFQHLFNAGTVVTGLDGTAIASVPAALGRVGVNYMDRDQVATALKEGRSSVGKPVLGKVLKKPILSIAAPIRGPQGKVIGALIGIIDLGQPTFLDKVSSATSGKTGTVSLVSVPHRLTVTSSDKKLVLFALPAPGVNPSLDRNMAGFEGSAIVVNALGQEQLASVKKIPAAQWYLFSGLPIEEVFVPVRAMQRRVLIATILLTLLAGGLTWWMLRRQLAPVFDTARRLAHMAESIETPRPLPITGRDEIGELIGGFNRLLETLGRRETALQKSEADLAITLNSIGDAVIATDPAGRVTRMNPSAERMTGWALAGATGHPLTEVFHIVNAATREPVADPVQLVMARGEIVGLANHTVLLAKDGQEYQIADSAAPIRDAAGVITGVVLVFSDVTQKYQVQEALRVSEERFNLFMNTLPAAAFIKDEDSTTLYANRYMEKIFGTQDWIGKSAWELFPHDLAEKMIADDRRSMEAGYVVTEDEVPGTDGQLRCYQTYKFCIPRQGRRPLLGGIALDISERKQHEARQLTASERMEVLLKLPDAAEGRSETEFLQYGLDQVEALTGSQIAFVHFVNDDQETIELLTWSQSTLKNYCTATFDRHYPISQAGIWADALRQRQPVLINDYAKASGKHGLPEGHAHLERLISVPVIEGGLVRMMLGVGNKAQPYSELDVETTRLLAESLWHIASLRRVEAALRKSQQSLNQAQFIAGIGNYSLDLAAGLWESSHALDQIFGIDAAYQRSVQGWEDIIHPDDRAMMSEYFKGEVLGQRKPFDREYRIQRHNDKGVRWVHGLGILEFDTQGQLLQMHGTIQDITERKANDQKIQALAFSDPLTGLPNRRLLIDRLEQALVGALRHGHQDALLFIDMDDFKSLNDSLGHDTGDQLLQQIAQRLLTCVREGDTVARFGGDEFVVLLENLDENPQTAAMQAEVVGRKIHSALREPYQLDSLGYHSSASIGITLLGGALRESIEEPLKRAELAMYEAKAVGRDTLRFFEPGMRNAINTRVSLEADLHEALSQSQFLLYYQAQVDRNARPTGVEALVRWQHPERGLISPTEFIPVAEASGLILPLGHWVLETACKQLAAWALRPEMASLTISVNVSARQFRLPNFVEEVLTVLETTGANPERLILELTESLLLDNVKGVITKMNALKNEGVGFALDDFGTGYSSLAYLKRLPLDKLKIDQGFIKDILTDPDDAAIAKTVVALADSLGLSVIAEGVETEAQRKFLATLGCNNYQGYLFCRPLPIQEFEAFARRA